MLSRTRSRLRLFVKEFFFDTLKLEEVSQIRTQRALELSMGFHGQWDEHRRFQLDLIKREGVLPHHDLLEIGCGPLTAGIPLIQYLDPGKYVGVDVRTNVLNLAYGQVERAELSYKNPRLILSTTFGAEFLPAECFQFILAFSVLYHLTDAQVDEFFKSVSRYLFNGGKCIVNVNTCTPSSTWLEFPFEKRPVAFYSDRAARCGLQAEDLGPMKDLGFKLDAEEAKNRILRLSRSYLRLP